MADRKVVRRTPSAEDLPDPEDLGTAGDWLAHRAVTILINYDPVADTVRIDRGTTPKTIAAALLEKAWHENADPVTWGEPPEEDEDVWVDE